MKRKSVYVEKRTNRVKVKTLVYIDKELFEQVMELAPRVYGVARGALSMAVDEALRYWVRIHSAHTARVNPLPSHRNVYNCVIRCIEDRMDVVPITLPQRVMEECILSCRDAVDPRTAWKWLHVFYVNGWIKPLTVRVTGWRDWRHNRSVELVARSA